MAIDFNNRIEDEVIIEKVTSILSKRIENKLEELHERNASPYINGIEGLAKYLGVGLTLAQELKNNKEVPSYQRGRVVWFKKIEVDKYIDKLRN